MLRKIDFDSRWRPDWLGLILRDDRYLYVNGHRLDEPDSFTVLAQNPGISAANFLRRLTPASRCLSVPGILWREHVRGLSLTANRLKPIPIPFDCALDARIAADLSR
jgi:hypothetical protein